MLTWQPSMSLQAYVSIQACWAVFRRQKDGFVLLGLGGGGGGGLGGWGGGGRGEGGYVGAGGGGETDWCMGEEVLKVQRQHEHRQAMASVQVHEQ